MISVSVGFKLRARTSVPNSEVYTWPFCVLSNRAKISLISFDEKGSAIKKIIGWLENAFSFKLTRHCFVLII